jgi:hypothetical protein
MIRKLLCKLFNLRLPEEQEEPVWLKDATIMQVTPKEAEPFYQSPNFISVALYPANANVLKNEIGFSSGHRIILGY